MGGAQSVWLADTPEPGLENTYSTGGKQQGTFLLGLALEKTFTTPVNNFETAMGVEVDYLKNASMTGGIVQPMVNVDPNFDTLNYAYSMKSYLLLATARASKLNILPKLGAYLQGGVGAALNKLTHYTETSPDGSSSAPMLAPFGDGSNKKFAYSIGAGVVCQVGKSSQVLIGYRYINSGMGGFKTSPVQQTNNTLHFSPITHHFLTLTLSV
ncbi:MAG: hypothetical protein P4M12_05765 [Gammaproteobacteria bacterium]|nr:hypothetical protein [Gammaproteobacteria bacterium]